MTELQKELFRLQDLKYAEFQARLVPTIDRETIIGVRIPALRKLAKEFQKSSQWEVFLDSLPHRYYEENSLHAILLCSEKNLPKCIERVNAFLPYVDNWAVCDTIRPKAFEKHKQDALQTMIEWAYSEKEFTARFGLEMLEVYFLDEDFFPEILETAASIQNDAYYVRMMVAWLFATALSKQWDATIPYIEQNRLSQWTHEKSIQKAIESFRISDEQKQYLRTLK